ncbi:MAG: hypothetical protein NTX25_04315 [Proteobacteria bacterium]|nr:hypothetical protein [Pseudomonadota bacterium]
MPAKSIVNLEDLIPDEAKMRLSYLGYNFIELKNRIVDSGASPQTIFSEQIGDLKISVWLE